MDTEIEKIGKIYDKVAEQFAMLSHYTDHGYVQEVCKEIQATIRDLYPELETETYTTGG